MATWTLVLIIFGSQPTTVTFPDYVSDTDCLKAGAAAVNNAGAVSEERSRIGYACIARPR
jgi:hypothetical protein